MPFDDLIFRIGPYGVDHDERLRHMGDIPFLSQGSGSIE